MSNEAAVRLVLDQLAKEKGFDSWKELLDFANTSSDTKIAYEDAKEVAKAAELGFEAGQKQEQSRCEGIVNEEIERVVNKYGLKKRLFSEGGEKK